MEANIGASVKAVESDEGITLFVDASNPEEMRNIGVQSGSSVEILDLSQGDKDPGSRK